MANANERDNELQARVDEECTTLQLEADMAADEELGEEASDSLRAVRRIGLYRALQQRIQDLRANTPPATAAADGPFVVVDGDGHRFRTLHAGITAWTTDVNEALWFARRSDADQFAAEDIDAWLIWPVREAEARRADDKAPKEMQRSPSVEGTPKPEGALPAYAEEYFDSIDASFFSGDTFHNRDALNRYRWYVARWNREAESIEQLLRASERLEST